MKVCQHTRVIRMRDHAKDYVEAWCCVDCGMEFKPAADEPQADMSLTLDAIAATFSAVMYDYTQRMAEERGLQPKDQEPDSCQDGHIRDRDGICRECGNNPFLGGADVVR